MRPEEDEEYQKKIKSDSLDGVYIPKNIEECFLELNKLLSEEEIKQFKELKSKDEAFNYHFSIGMWMRNNWGFWGGSRFQLYMKDRMDEIFVEPDDMSGMILEFYWEWLNGKNKNWEKFDKKRNKKVPKQF
jgi:hypothetical protein